MKLQAAVQEALVGLLCYEEVSGSHVASMVELSDFDPVYREVAELALDYRRRFKIAPNEHVFDLFETAKERNPRIAVHLDRMLESIEATHSTLNPEFILEQTQTFVRYQRLKSGMEQALRDLAQDNEEGLESAEASLYAALKQTTTAFHAGTDLFNDAGASLRFLEEPETSFPTGIKIFDQLHLGPVRNRLHLLMGRTGFGKSWWLVNLGVQAVKRGKNVLFISLELDEPEVAQRFVQSMFAITKRRVPDGVRWHQFIQTHDDGDNGVRLKARKSRRPSLEDDGAAEMIRKKLNQWSDQGRVLIRSFPQSSLTPQQLQDYISVLAERSKFLPDLVLIDYIDIMRRPRGVDRWEGIIENTEACKRLCQEMHVAGASVSQIKIDGVTARRVGIEHTSGAYDKVSHVDTLITASATEEEKRNGIVRLHVEKSRTEKDGITVLVSQSLDTGQFVRDSIVMGRNYDSTKKPRRRKRRVVDGDQ